MKYTSLFTALVGLLVTYSLNAQTKDTAKAKKTTVVDTVEKMPEFPGGDEALIDYLNKNIHYPAYARENNIQGTVRAQFNVDETGHLTDLKIISSPSQDMSDEVLRVMKLMPLWKPGTKGGVPVKVKYTLPVAFQLSGDSPKKKKQKT